MGPLSRGIVALLLLMLVHVVLIIINRMARYWVARRQSRDFIRDSETSLRQRRYADAIAIATSKPKSHVAKVVAAGLTSLASAPPHLADAEASESAQRAMQRTQRRVYAELKRGINTLTAIASTAPFLGLLGTVIGIFNAFGATAMSKSAWLGYTAETISEALVTTALGLLVAVPAVWCRNYLRDCVELFDTEMSNAELETITYVAANRELRGGYSATAISIFEASGGTNKRPWEVPYDRLRVFLLAMWTGALFVGFLFAEATYSSFSFHPVVESEWDRYIAFGGLEAVSPDGKFRAIVPVIYREKLWSVDERGRFSCGPYPTVALRIIPNDRPQAWKRRECAALDDYVLESGDVLLTRNCRIPVVAWRTNNELLVQCDDCSADDLSLLKLDYFHRKVIVLDRHRNELKLRLTEKPECVVVR